MMTDSRNQERRRYVRLEQGHVLRHEKYRFLPSPKGKPLNEGVLRNYSGGGVLFESNVKYDIGDVLRLEITIPGWEMYKNEFYREDKIPRPEPVVILASVVRVEVFDAPGHYDVGAKFAGIDEGDRWALMKQIKRELTA
jgi:hypothetical protein